MILSYKKGYLIQISQYVHIILLLYSSDNI